MPTTTEELLAGVVGLDGAAKQMLFALAVGGGRVTKAQLARITEGHPWHWPLLEAWQAWGDSIGATYPNCWKRSPTERARMEVLVHTLSMLHVNAQHVARWREAEAKGYLEMRGVAVLVAKDGRGCGLCCERATRLIHEYWLPGALPPWHPACRCCPTPRFVGDDL